jgi:predicted acylesterase/phospholipase RssA
LPIGESDLNHSSQSKGQQECHDMKLFGICLSAGGIRSATFALGVLQGLTEKGLLPKADYLSTISGGAKQVEGVARSYWLD